LSPQLIHSTRLWSTINSQPDLSSKFDLFHLTLLLEDHIQQKIHINSLSSPNFSGIKDNSSFDFYSLISFYTAPEFPLQKKYSSKSLLHQILYPTPPHPNQNTSNHFSAFFDDSEMTPSQMEIENHPDQHRDHPETPSPTLKPAWTNDTTVSALSDDIFQQLQKHQ
jgi:hypothetical protein